MRKRNAHALFVYHRAGRLFVCASLATHRAYENLGFVIEVENAFDGLAEAMSLAETRALEALALPEAQRRFADDAALIKAAGCKTYRAFVKGTVAAQVYRLPKECRIAVWVPSAREDSLEPTDYHQAYDPKAAIETLAQPVRDALESV